MKARFNDIKNTFCIVAIRATNHSKDWIKSLVMQTNTLAFTVIYLRFSARFNMILY